MNANFQHYCAFGQGIQDTNCGYRLKLTTRSEVTLEMTGEMHARSRVY
jgi:hypothetical protein